MFKAISTLVSIAAATFSSEFMQGAQTAIFLTSDADFADYSCPIPEENETVAY